MSIRTKESEIAGENAVMNIRMSPLLKKAVREYCAQDGRSMASLIDVALKKYISSHKPALASLYAQEARGASSVDQLLQELQGNG